MFREYPIDQGDLALENTGFYDEKEKVTRTLELNENLFNNLESAAANLPKLDRPIYEAQLAEVRRFVFEDVERLFNMLVPNPDKSRVKVLEEAHGGLKSVAQLGLRLKEAGMKVPWLNPHWEEAINNARRGDTHTDSHVSPFRSMKDEQMLELITRHDALQIALNYKTIGEKSRGAKLTEYQAKSVEHIRKEFEDLPPEYQSEFKRLISDEDFYHHSLETLTSRQAGRFVETSAIN